MTGREDPVTWLSGSFLPVPPRDPSRVSGAAPAGKAKRGAEIEMSLDTGIRVGR